MLFIFELQSYECSPKRCFDSCSHYTGSSINDALFIVPYFNVLRHFDVGKADGIWY